MARSLAKAQKSFAEALTDPTLPAPAGIVRGRKHDAVRRFAIYRNNVAVSLVDALSEAFPVTVVLVGDAFFRAMARAFVGKAKPKSPVLSEYGAEFPDFIRSFAPASAVPYLADVAKIEATWTAAYHAADAAPCSASALGQLGESAAEARVRFLPSAQWVESDFPAGTIWLAHQRGTDAPEAWCPESVLIWRPEMEVETKVLDGAIRAFVSKLFAGNTIGVAAAAGILTDRGFDPGRALLELATSGCIWKFEEGDRREQ